MKKLIIVVVLLLSFLGYSQSDNRFGLKVGANLATFKGDIGVVENILAYHAGLVFEAPISNHLSFQPEFLYSVKGAKFSNEASLLGVKLSGETKKELTYISAPFTLKLYLSDNLSLQVGPQLGYLLSAQKVVEKSIENGDKSSVKTSGAVDIKSKYERLDYGVVLGIGFRFDNSVILGGRYSFGMANVLKNDSNSVVTNNVIQLYAGFLF